MTGAMADSSNHAGQGAARLRAVDVELGYDQRTISTDLSLDVPDGSFTVIIGPNGCGKSTLLRALANLVQPRRGQVLLDGAPIAGRRPKEVARDLGLLPQTAIAPDGITVADLVARGRFPYQGVLRQWGSEDQRAVAEALAATQLTELSGRQVGELSGGQRQRVWVAMVLAQQTPLVLLDEPTTYLDVAHQVELMDLFRRLNREGRTLVAVLHDLNQAARYATHLVAMKDGRIVAEGRPAEILTSVLVEEVFGLPNVVITDPVTGGPLVVPLQAGVDAPAAALT